jgi:hypothetical protein
MKCRLVVEPPRPKIAGTLCYNARMEFWHYILFGLLLVLLIVPKRSPK